jgi:two-component system sensor histidine kinase SenX3
VTDRNNGHVPTGDTRLVPTGADGVDAVDGVSSPDGGKL